ncbi:MAG: regulatory signaling modulator protein AmpE [Pseudomonadales bacterium]
MEFLAIVISAAALYLGHAERNIQRDNWFYGLGAFLQGLPFSQTTTRTLTILVPVAAVYYLQTNFEGRGFGIPELLLMLLVLLYSLGRNDLNAILMRYRSSLRNEDMQAAALAAEGIAEDAPPEDFPQLHTSVEQWTVYRRFEHWFAVVFWFLLLGPAGALAYRLVQLTVTKEGLFGNVLALLDWLPVRILGLSFALIGDFVSAMQELQVCFLGSAKADACVYKLACAALQFDSGCELSPAEGDSRLGKLVSLLQRSLVLWIALIAIAQIAF